VQRPSFYPAPAPTVFSASRKIKADDGLALAQDEDSAEYNGMPASAVRTGLVDIVLPPEKKSERLEQFFKVFRRRLADATAAAGRDAQINKIFAILRTKVGHDFSVYKINTILRRIMRRMGVNWTAPPEWMHFQGITCRYQY
jgi:two-component system CheB/CheR fusion protein